ncbi:unnamed protein product, partial [Ixodes hexagonus]
LPQVTSYRDLGPSKSPSSSGAAAHANGATVSPRARFLADSEPTYIVAHNSALKRSSSSLSGLVSRNARLSNGAGSFGTSFANGAYCNGNSNGHLGPGSPDFYAPNPALWGPGPRSEFDASSFADFVARGAGGAANGGVVLNDYNLSKSTSDLHREPWSPDGRGAPVVDYATQSLDRPKFRKQGRHRMGSLEELDVRGFGDVTLERLPERPFQYLERPGSVLRIGDSDTSSSHSIRDIAL